jgi:hypothetical protein
MLTLAFKFIIGHAVADFVLQPTAMARGKNRHLVMETLEGQKNVLFWPYWMSAHALVHGGIVWFISGNPVMGLAEFILHWIFDFAKCERWTNIHIDQLLHMICKAVYIFLLLR